jgi:hypothetical protein
MKHQKWDDQGGTILKRGRATKGDSRHEAGAALITDAAKKLAEQRPSPEKKQKRAAARNAEVYTRLDMKAEDRTLELDAEGRLVDHDKEGFSGRSFDGDYVHSAQKKSPVLEEYLPGRVDVEGADVDACEGSKLEGKSWRLTAGLDAGAASHRYVSEVPPIPPYPPPLMDRAHTRIERAHKLLSSNQLRPPSPLFRSKEIGLTQSTFSDIVLTNSFKTSWRSAALG